MEPADIRVACELRACPRCGYDLSGMIGSWQTECPLEGTCSECGLRFAWVDVFYQLMYEPGWSFEHGRQVSARRLALTLLRASVDPGAWASLRMERPIVLRRLFLYGALTLLGAHLVMGVLSCASWNGWAFITVGTAPELLLLAPRLLWPYGEDHVIREAPAFPAAMVWAVAHWVCMPLLLLVLDETFRRCKVRPIHILRGAVYSLASVLVVLGVSLAGTAIDPPVSRGAAAPLALLVITVASWGWWWNFLQGYLRLRRAWLIVCVLMGVTVLASVTLGAGLIALGVG